MPSLRTIRSGPFRLALLFAAIFAFGSIMLVIVVETAVASYARQVTTDTLTTEGLRLVGIARLGGRNAVVAAIDERARQRQRSFLYLLVDRGGLKIAGDLPSSANRIGWATIMVTETVTADDPQDGPTPMRIYGVELTHGDRLIVGSDIYDVQELREWLNVVALWSGTGITLLALVAGYWIAAIFTRRLERVNGSIATIMSGRLDERLPAIGMGEEFDRLSANLNLMLDRIETLMAGVRQVSTDIAHDLRTPLTRLRQQLEASIGNGDVPVPPLVIHHAIAQIDTIMRIFAALLRIATIEAGAGRARFQRVDLSEVMQRVLLAYQPVADDEGRTLIGAIESGVVVNGDADLLAQLFTNLVENALMHTGSGATIELKLQRNPQNVTAAVSDSGPGIPEAERENVFRQFYRGDNSRAREGHGLGLALVLAIAGLHKAKLILADNAPGLSVTLNWPQEMESLSYTGSTTTVGHSQSRLVK